VVWAILLGTILVAVKESVEAFALFVGREVELTDETRLNPAFAQPMGALIVLAWLLYAPQARRPDRKLLRWGAYALVAFLVAGLMVNLKKVGLFSFPLAFLVVLARASRPRHFSKKIAVLVVLPAALALLTFVALPRVSSNQMRRLTRTAMGQHLSSAQRLQIWRMSLEMWRDHPWLGVGFSPVNLDAVYRDYYRYGDLWTIAPPFFTHNDYLNLLATGGVIALAIWLTMVASAYRRLLRLSWQDPTTAWVKAALLGMWTCFLAYHLFDPFNNIRRPYFCILLALIATSGNLFVLRSNAAPPAAITPAPSLPPAAGETEEGSPATSPP
jgi:O-antigen ligase